MLLASRLQSEDTEIKIGETIGLPAVLYGHETWTLSIKRGRRLVLGNRAPRGSGKRMEMTAK
jgi:hypothetical protein